MQTPITHSHFTPSDYASLDRILTSVLNEWTRCEQEEQKYQRKEHYNHEHHQQDRSA